MIFKYGDYAHQPNEVALAIQKRPVYGRRGFRTGTRETWRLQGVLNAGTQAQLTAAIAGLQQAYAVNGRDAGLYLDDGATLTSHFLTSSATVGGVKVAALEFPEGRGAEYSTFRSYAITLEALFADPEHTLLWFHESLTFLGTGGPRFLFLPTLTGLPQKQQVHQRTTVTVLQSGSAVGHSQYPAVPAPIWPQAEHVEQRRITPRSPRFDRGSLTEFAVDWQYTFESSLPLVGIPHQA